jgi:hypothetical protein
LAAEGAAIPGFIPVLLAVASLLRDFY